MDFKLLYNENHTVIVPETANFTARWAKSLEAHLEKLMAEGDRSFIVDMLECNLEDEEVLDQLLGIHDSCYTNGCSLVFTQFDAANMAWIKKTDAAHTLNIAPKMAEAIDIVTMEQLERDLFDEE